MTIDAASAMINAVLDAVRQWGNAGCTFASLEKVPGFSGGTAVMTDPDDPNCVIWDGMSTEAAAAICHLINANKIHLRGTSYKSYELDGRVLKLRVKQRTTPPGARYWRPTAVHLGPPVRVMVGTGP
jgi:hypothetical protein